MYLTPKNVKLKRTTYIVLSEHDIVKGTDLVRTTVYPSSSDYVFDSDINQMNWQLVSTSIPFLVGKNVKDFEAKAGYSLHLEILREIGLEA